MSKPDHPDLAAMPVLELPVLGDLAQRGLVLDVDRVVGPSRTTFTGAWIQTRDGRSFRLPEGRLQAWADLCQVITDPGPVEFGIVPPEIDIAPADVRGGSRPLGRAYASFLLDEHPQPGELLQGGELPQGGEVS